MEEQRIAVHVMKHNTTWHLYNKTYVTCALRLKAIEQACCANKLILSLFFMVQ